MPTSGLLLILAPLAQEPEPPPPPPDRPARLGAIDGVVLSATYAWEGFEVVGESFETNGNLDLTLALDLERTLGLAGWTGRVHAIASHGDDLAGAVGDLQLASNIEAPETTRLFQAWIERRRGGTSLRAGLYDITSEFDVIPSGQLFVHSSPGTGAEFAGSGRNGPSTFPVSGLAARLELTPAEHWTARLAVGDGVPGDPLDPASNAVTLSGEDGAVFVGELARERAGTKAAVGAWGYTTEFPAPGGGTSTGSHGAYAFVDHPLLGEPAPDARHLSGFARVGYADRRNAPVDRFVGGGLVLHAPFAGRRADRLGLAFAAARLTAEGADWETAFELTYRAQLSAWFALQPDVQLVVDPSGTDQRDDALLVGLRATLVL